MIKPGRMLVQKRTTMDSNSNPTINSNSYSAIKIRVNYNSSLREIQINPHSTLGGLKKKLEGATGLSPRDQKLMHRGKELHSDQFLHLVGVKHGSTLDLLSQDSSFRLHRNSAMNPVAEVAMEIDRLAGQVKGLESVAAKGGSVGEKEALVLTEMLMGLLIRLDGIVAAGEVKLQRKTQVMRIQGYIERLDKLKTQKEEIQPQEGIKVSK